MRVKIDRGKLLTVGDLLEQVEHLMNNGLRHTLEAMAELALERQSSAVIELHRGLDQLYRALAKVRIASDVLDTAMDNAEYTKDGGERDDGKDDGSF